MMLMLLFFNYMFVRFTCDHPQIYQHFSLYFLLFALPGLRIVHKYLLFIESKNIDKI